MKRRLYVLLLCFPVQLFAAELNTVMMESTYKIQGQGSMGTGFIIGKPDPNDPEKVFLTLITADHVLKALQGETAVLVARRKDESNGWRRVEHKIRVRDGAKALWTKHPEVDVAGMFIELPINALPKLILKTTELVADEELSRYEIYPGMELMCLGYPLGLESNDAGFSILRSGRIASYPLTPTKKTKSFLFDFNVYPGNSGGPVYFVQHDPTYGGSRRIGTSIYGIIGLLVEERRLTQQVIELYEKRETSTPLQIGSVVHASFIKELVESLGYPK